MIPLKKWWLTQASMDIAKDPELLDLMKASGCIGVFLESSHSAPTPSRMLIKDKIRLITTAPP